MDYTIFLSLFGGLALFLYGMKVMGDGLERAAGPRLKTLLGKMTKNRFLAVLTGVAVTAVVQSSSATTVMVVGFVNAKLLSLSQAIGVIMGANIGTTVTSLLLSVKLDIGAVFALCGMMAMFVFKKEVIRQLGAVMMGLGVLFTGMNIMSDSMAPLREWEGFQTAMMGIGNPILGVLVGAGITALLQSSSASVGILQVLAQQGLVAQNTAFYILLGTNIGTCVTALLASTGTGVTAKRAATVHLLFNVVGTGVFLVASAFLDIPLWMANLAGDGNIKLQIAFTHVFFNVVSTLILLPFAGILEKIACVCVRGQEPAAIEKSMEFYDERLLATPAIAAEQLFRETCRMGHLARDNMKNALNDAMTEQVTDAKTIEDTEDLVDYLEEGITEGLISVKSYDLSERDNRRIGAMFHVTNDFERISDHAMNFCELAKERVRRDVTFSEHAKAELDDMILRVLALLDSAVEAFSRGYITQEQMMALEFQEENIDRLTKKYHDEHIKRLKDKKCTPKSGMVYLEMLHNLERAADHAMNVAGLTEKR